MDTPAYHPPFLIDYRHGSGELSAYLAMLGLPVQTPLPTLAFGDMCFLGQGADECPIPIGVERKALSDFVSSVRSGRLAGHQLTGLLNSYKETWIVVEGDWRIAETTGHVQTLQWVKKGKKQWVDLDTHTEHALMYQELEAMFLTLEMKGGMRFRFTRDKMQTCRFLAGLYHWWTDKEWKAHRSHLKFHSQFADKNLLTPPTLCREWAARLPGVGYEKSALVADHFGSCATMVTAPEAEWVKIKGIGKKIAEEIQRVIWVAGARCK